ncbi:MAG: hypothetical protein AABZ06_10065 [Bdellovibrionota bacterium]
MARCICETRPKRGQPKSHSLTFLGVSLDLACVPVNLLISATTVMDSWSPIGTHSVKSAVMRNTASRTQPSLPDLSGTYRPRRSEETVLYQAVANNIRTFEALAELDGKHIPKHVSDELEAFLIKPPDIAPPMLPRQMSFC